MLLQPLARSPGDSRQPYATSEPDLAPHTQARWKMDDLEGNCSTISSGLHASSNEQKLESSVTDSAYTSSGSTTADSESQDDHSGLTVKPENSEDDNRQEVEDSEDDHRADQLDHQASIEEEQHLMQLFERERNN